MLTIHPPPAIFKNAFDEYNFAIISNLFNSDKPYALSTQSKMCQQTTSYLAKHSKLESKNLNKICPKFIQKALKCSLQHVKFQKFFGEACPLTPLEPL